ncbi:metal-dependent hydrolase [Photobacterium kishitanii]|uniref:Metal-dependent hydrolase n=1 Tax=Photobacterium kishitanii TaxID=318456 RepID=A0A2T3KMR1_9GAMM|nr:metal-dependent hydrolase [Photobacterium kishitanii]PSV01086.1 hypothetical protein C9J27_03445 [Photobacterium kishitanii]
MTGQGHTAAGIVSGIAPASAAYVAGGIVPAIAAWIFTISGSTAPDWLECPREKTVKINGSNRKVISRVLNHRGVTHTISYWCLATLFFYFSLTNQKIFGHLFHIDTLVASIALGFFYGGCIHLLGDLPNRQKIPVFLYKYDGISLNLFKSGRWEKTTVFICAVISVLISLYIINGWTPLGMLSILVNRIA